jgi:hypothetical protein
VTFLISILEWQEGHWIKIYKSGNNYRHKKL